MTTDDGQGGPLDPDLYDEISRLNNELAAAHREMAKKNAELQRLNDVKNQYLGMAAHDLRNPLGAIEGYATILRDSPDSLDASERAEMLDLILDASRSMRRLVEDLLDVSAIEAGHVELERRTVDLAGLVERTVQSHRVVAGAKDIDIRFSSEPTPPVSLDAAKIEQVVANLVDNAVKYSPRGGAVDVRVGCVEEDRVEIAVEDEGDGIPDDEQRLLFRPFGTTSSRPTGGEASHGLGLVIVRRIVEEHGGTVGLTSEVGSGSTFTVTLPIGGSRGD